MVLKPQDIVVVLKLCAYKGERPSFAQIAEDLNMSASEVHAATKRARVARLLHGPELKNRPNYKAIEEFLVHGLKYAFPAVRGQMTRGIPTSYAAEPLCHYIQSGNDPVPVWPSEEGRVKGIALEPLYPSVSLAVKKDRCLYEFLTLVDALRDGRARERQIAEKELSKRLKAHKRK